MNHEDIIPLLKDIIRMLSWIEVDLKMLVEQGKNKKVKNK